MILTQRDFYRLIIWLCIVLAFFVGARARFSHPNLTETGLLLQLWPYWLLVLALCIVAVLFARIGMSKPKDWTRV